LTIQVATLSKEELYELVKDAKAEGVIEGYLMACEEWNKKQTTKDEPKFGELLTGAKELHAYLKHKNYTTRSLSYIEKVAPQLLKTKAGEKQGKTLLFHTYLLDYEFDNGFKFISTSQKETSKKIV
jgi:hypothetical protein